jgi:16S rRNA (guanine527-N7)-methyltransferase
VKAQSTLASGLGELGLALSAEAQMRLLSYLALIEKWNKVYNLTAIRDTQDMVREHLLDSLTVAEYVQPHRVLDVGSGAGLPGIPLAIARPELTVTLLDSNGKKSAFLQQARIELQLPNAEVVCTRVETYRPSALFDTVVTRAFADTRTIAKLCVPLLNEKGIVLAMKGAAPADELAALPQGAAAARVVRLHVPGSPAQRHLVVMTKAS